MEFSLCSQLRTLLPFGSFTAVCGQTNNLKCRWFKIISPYMQTINVYVPTVRASKKMTSIPRLCAIKTKHSKQMTSAKFILNIKLLHLSDMEDFGRRGTHECKLQRKREEKEIGKWPKLNRLFSISYSKFVWQF